MKIIGKVKPADIPENQRGKAHKKYMELWRQIAALAPGEVLKIECEYSSQAYLIRDNVKKQFKHSKYDVIARRVNGIQYTYIHYNREV